MWEESKVVGEGKSLNNCGEKWKKNFVLTLREKFCCFGLDI
jgi:hypothetical protein